MSDSLINRILTLSGPMPDVERHRRYLQGLNVRQLQEREAALLSGPRQERPAVQFWGPQKKRASKGAPCPA